MMRAGAATRLAAAGTAAIIIRRRTGDGYWTSRK